MIDGDIVWFTGFNCYFSNVRFAENNKNKDGFVSPHDLDSANYDKDEDGKNTNIVVEENSYNDYVDQGLLGLALNVIIGSGQLGYKIYDDAVAVLTSVYEFFTKKIPELLQKAYDTVVAIYTKVKIVLLDVKNSIDSYFKIIYNAIEKWCKSKFDSGYKYATAHPQFTLDTTKLSTYAQRLTSVNTRIAKIDKRLDGLYWQVGLACLWDLLQADLSTNNSWRLDRCAGYLNDTARSFESLESNLIKSL